jgi:hypothetical protein
MEGHRFRSPGEGEYDFASHDRNLTLSAAYAPAAPRPSLLEAKKGSGKIAAIAIGNYVAL